MISKICANGSTQSGGKTQVGPEQQPEDETHPEEGGEGGGADVGWWLYII